MSIDWKRSPEFEELCDAVASNYLVCVTGAGISRDLPRKDVPGETLPGWVRLLRELLGELESAMPREDAESARRLLDLQDERPAAAALRQYAEESAPAAVRDDLLDSLAMLGPAIGSRELILAASLIRRSGEVEFDRRFRAAITEEPGSFGPVHEAILDLLPRGIMTFNYDGGHEAACDKRGLSLAVLNPIDPSSEEQFRSLTERRHEELFLLKAHGSVGSSAQLVLTVEEYRTLLAKNPAYRAFVQNLFTNFNFLMVGYGLDDPDFDLFLWTMAEQYGGPLQRHFVIRPIFQRLRQEEVERRMYGIRTLHVNGFEEIPEVLVAAASTAGPKLRRTLDLCLSSLHEKRVAGHQELRKLGPAGRLVAAREMLARLAEPDSFIVSEAAYSLGVIDPRAYKERLCELIDEGRESQVLGRVLAVLRAVFEPSDVPRLKAWWERFSRTPPPGERPERIARYIEDTIYYVEHKFQSDPPDPTI